MEQLKKELIALQSALDRERYDRQRIEQESKARVDGLVRDLQAQ